MEHVPGQSLVQEPALQEEGDHPPAEASGELLEIDLGDVNESALRVESPLEEQAVPVGMTGHVLDRPLLLIHDHTVRRGIFDRGALPSFVYAVGLRDRSWPLQPPDSWGT